MIWRKLNGEILLPPIKEAVKDVLIEEAKNNTKLKVCIGTDSQVKEHRMLGRKRSAR